MKYTIDKKNNKYCLRRNINIKNFMIKNYDRLLNEPIRLKGSKTFKARIKDKYRILYTIPETLTIKIIKIENRSKAYKNLGGKNDNWNT